VHEFNVYRWAGHMLSDAARWRLRARVEARVRRFQRTDLSALSELRSSASDRS
jgi:trehalose 6-phosphate synthase